MSHEISVTKLQKIFILQLSSSFHLNFSLIVGWGEKSFSYCREQALKKKQQQEKGSPEESSGEEEEGSDSEDDGYGDQSSRSGEGGNEDFFEGSEGEDENAEEEKNDPYPVGIEFNTLYNIKDLKWRGIALARVECIKVQVKCYSCKHETERTLSIVSEKD